LTASGGTSYAWSTGATTAAITINPAATTTYTVTVTNANNCSQTASQVITVDPLPLPVIAISETSGVANNDGIICDGASVTLTASGGTSYTWSTGATTAAITINPVATTIYTVTVTNANNCSQSASQVITVNPLPVPVIAISETSGVANNDGIICEGASVTLTAFGGTSYAWSTGATTAAITINPVATTTYTVTVTNANNCSQSASQVITVNPLPIPTITLAETSGLANNDGTICEGASVTLTASGGTSYLWSTGATTDAITVNPAATTTYTVTVTNANNCSQSASQVITVNPLPVPAIAISETSGVANNDGTICEGASVTLTASGGTSYAWNTGETTAAITINPAATTTYTVTVTSNGCSQSASRVITVNPLPVPVIAISETSGVAINDGIICEGASVTLTASGGTSYLWSTGATTDAVTVNPSASATYNVTVTSNGCSQSASQVITVNPLPVPVIAISETSGVANNDGIVCEGASVTLTASGGTSYLWSTGETTDAITVNPASTTTYSVTVTNANNCSQTASQVITVNPLPVPVIAISETSGVANNDGIICDGASVTLTATGGTSYLWSTGETTDAITVNPAATTTYTVTVTNANNCSQSISQVITVDPLPTPVIAISETSGLVNNDGIICDGASVILTASGGTSYLWSTGETTPAIAVNPSSISTYTVTVTNANNCSQSISQVITVNPLPTPTITLAETSGLANNDGTICEGASVTLTATGGASYIWSTGETTPSITVSPAATTVYTVTVTNANNCSNIANQSVIVEVLPIASIAVAETSGLADDDGIICEGSTVILTATGGTSYLWSNGESTPAITINPVLTTTYTVTVTNSAGCTDTESYTVNVNPNPIPVLTGVSPVCQGSDGNVYTTDPGMTTYTWDIPVGATVTGGGTSTDNTVTIRWDVDGSHLLAVNYSNSNNCSALVPTSLTVVVDKAPTANAGPDDSICYDATYQIPSAIVTDAVSYLWKTTGDGKFENGLGTISNIIAPVYTPGDIDKNNGFAKLVLEVTGAATCNVVRDTIKIVIPQKLQAAIGAPKPFDIDASTHIQVHIKTTGHRNIGDLGYYLVAPDGNTVITLRSNSPQPCNIGYDADVIFDSQSLNALNVCTLPARPLGQYTVSGTYQAEGSWSALYNNFNPAEGGWSVQVRDNVTLSPLVSWPQGNLVEANITFTSADGKSVNFASGPINIPIKNGNASLPAKTSYMVPLGLRTTCSNSCDASAIVNVIGGVAPFTYIWNDPANSTTSTLDLCKGNFSVTVTDAIGCTAVASVEVTSPPAIVLGPVTYSNNDTLKCYGDNTDITITATGGTGALKYTYTGAPAPNDTLNIGTAFTNLGAGIYNFRIFDVNGCIKDTIINIVASEALTASVKTVTPNVCYGGNGGSVVIEAEGGNKKYVFTLKQAGVDLDTIYTMEDTATFTGLAAGAYTVAVRDTNMCSILTELDVVITQPATSLSIDLVTSGKLTTCASTADGWVKFETSGGLAPFTYTVYNATDTFESAQDPINGVIRGTYTAMITDDNGCTATYGTPVTIIADPAIIFTKPFAVTPVTKCYTNNDGTITVSATHDNGDPDNIEVAIDNVAGTYNPLMAPSYSYQFINLTPGWHVIYAKDVSNPGNCIFKDSAFVSAPAQIVITPVVTFVATNNYTVDVVATGGTGTLEYAFLDSNRDSIQGYGANNSFTGLTNGTYYALVRDGERCVAEALVNLADFTLAVTHLRCYNDNSGRIEVIAGIPGTYLYDLDKGAVQNNNGIFDNLGAGKHYIKVFNQLGVLVFNDSTILNQPATPLEVVNLLFPADLNKCSYDQNVSARMMVAVLGGGVPYEYSNDGIQYLSEPDLVLFGKGTHIVYVRDANGCVVQSTPITVTAPEPVTISVERIVPVKGSKLGSVSLKATGPEKPITFSQNGADWYGTTDSTHTFGSLAEGTYSFYAQNTIGCRDTISVAIPIAPKLNVKVLIDTSLVKCDLDNKAVMSLVITDSGVDSARYYITSSDTSWIPSTTQSYVDLAQGSYSIYVEDNLGRIFAKDTIIPGLPSGYVYTISNSDTCSNFSRRGHYGSLEVVTSTNYSNYSYSWSNGETTRIVNNLSSGVYSVTVKYGNNCSRVLVDTVGYIIDMNLNIVPLGTICPNTEYQLSLLNNVYADRYAWEPKTGLDNPTSATPKVKISQPMEYVLFAENNQFGCYDSVRTKINVYHVPQIISPDTFVVVPGGEMQLFANDSSFTTIIWNPAEYLSDPNAFDPIVRPDEKKPISQLEYTVTGITADLCYITDTVFVFSNKLNVPSGFTPNDDDKNNTWEIDFADQYPDMLVQVFNRWGQKVFEQKGYSKEKAWDGTRNGRPLPIGTYYYVIFPTKDSKLTGTVTIVR
jgi:gliding motility-associated-like protein